MSDKDDGARVKIAQRTGELLSIDDLPLVAREAAESLARQLMNDAVERVRGALADAARRAKCLPRDIALKIAHDVDRIACPFLQSTEAFSDDDWQQIVLTVSRTALSAIARRSPLSEGVALAVATVCNSQVAETLVENPNAPMTVPVCDMLMSRFESATWVLDKLAQRDDLFGDVAVRLTHMVSVSARERLIRAYGLPDFTAPIVIEAEQAVLLQIIRNTSEQRLPRLVQSLRRGDKLTPSFLLIALREELIDFAVAALSDLADTPAGEIRQATTAGDSAAVIKLFRKAHLPDALFDDLRKALTAARRSN